jgi:AcrR family transcriptional regulator
MATTHGLASLSLSQLAARTGLSKSGILTVFDDRQAVQLAAISEARRIVLEKVIDPAWNEAPGSLRLAAALDNWFTYVRDKVFPGGCFMAAMSAEFAGQEGLIAELARESKRSWLNFIQGELAVDAETNHHSPQELATALLMLDGLMLAGNVRYVLLGDRDALDGAQAACRDIIARW